MLKYSQSAGGGKMTGLVVLLMLRKKKGGGRHGAGLGVGGGVGSEQSKLLEDVMVK